MCIYWHYWPNITLRIALLRRKLSSNRHLDGTMSAGGRVKHANRVLILAIFAMKATAGIGYLRLAHSGQRPHEAPVVQAPASHHESHAMAPFHTFRCSSHSAKYVRHTKFRLLTMVVQMQNHNTTVCAAVLNRTPGI